jgi:hypothetical protein
MPTGLVPRPVEIAAGLFAAREPSVDTSNWKTRPSPDVA